MNRETLRKFQFPLMLALMLYPVCALGLGYADMALLKWRWALPGLLLVFSCLAMPIPGKLRLSLGFAGAAALVLLGGFLAYGVSICRGEVQAHRAEHRGITLCRAEKLDTLRRDVHNPFCLCRGGREKQESRYEAEEAFHINQ